MMQPLAEMPQPERRQNPSAKTDREMLPHFQPANHQEMRDGTQISEGWLRWKLMGCLRVE